MGRPVFTGGNDMPPEEGRSAEWNFKIYEEIFGEFFRQYRKGCAILIHFVSEILGTLFS
jgi:hypothetical protein